ncbi:MAG: sensor histidine kinase [Spirochaetota bacterium]
MGSTTTLVCSLLVAASLGVAAVSILFARRSSRGCRPSEMSSATLLDLTADAVIAYRFDPNGFGRIVETNEAACNTLGRTREELLALTPADLVPSGTARLYRRIQRLLPLDRPVPRLIDAFAADGTAVRLDATVRRFTDDGGEYVIVTARDAGERFEREQKLEQAIAGRDTLLREIHHRVKNNLQTISSLMNIRMLSSDDPGLQTALREMTDRVHAMGLLHRMLYETDDFEAVDLRSYTQMLSRQVWSSHSSSRARVAITVESDPLMVDLDTALPFGLLLNEAITNSLKHAFPDSRAGRVSVSVKADDEQVRLTIADDGVGMGTTNSPSAGMGTRMIRILACQLDGEASFVNGVGTTVNVRFPRERVRYRR